MGDEAHYLLEGEVEYQLDKQTKASSIDVSILGEALRYLV